ncbi:polysaccharide lyase-domain-containing protein [Aspergillus venezuelensis]
MSLRNLLLASLLLKPGLAGTLYASSFSSSLSPFSACNLKSPSTVTTTSGTAEFFFDETDFDGSRNDKGVEICVFEDETSTNVNQMSKEGWQGFNLYVSSETFPTDRSTIFAQQFCPGGCSSWCGELNIDGNKLVAEHRTGCVDPTTSTLVDEIEKDVWHDVVVHMRVSQEEDGLYEVWWDGEKVYRVDGINVGFGDWDGDSLSSGWYFKNGIYAFDIEDYEDGKTRTLLFDNVSWYEDDGGENDGYDTVAPGSAS